VSCFVHCFYVTHCINYVLSVILQLMDACALYKEEDKEKKSFQLLHCWNLLRHESKWHQHMIKLTANKSSQKKHKTLDDSVLDLTGNPNDEMTNADNNGNATLDGDAPKRPMGRKKAKQLLRRGGGDVCIKAFEQMWTKKKEADADKEAKKDDRFNKALEIEKEKLHLEQLRAAREEGDSNLKRMLEKDRIMTLNLSVMSVQKQLYYESLLTEITTRLGMSLP
jgi:hypothetical protein